MTPSTGWSRELLRSQTLRHPLMPRIPPFVLLIAASFAGTVNAQATENSLTALELEATYPEPFSYLRGVRELSNGLILAADPISQVLVRFDMDTGTADTLGREGAGPQEYDGPDRVFALPGDSTLLVDLGNGRFIVIDPEGTFVDWIPMSSEDPQWRGRQRQIGLQSVDESGNLYFIQPRSYSYGGPDSNDVRRLDRATGTEARVASQWFTKSVMRTRGSKPRILKLADDWAVGGDGQIAVIRANGYSVDWYYPNGTSVQGPPTEVETFPVGLAEKEFELERRYSTGIASVGTWENGVRISGRSYRGRSPARRRGTDEWIWPETLPVFRGEATLVSPRGEAWVHRIMPAGEPGRVEVFDEQGIRSGFIELPPQSQVIGFGARTEGGVKAYLARTDELGLVWLERYRVRRVGG